MTTKIVYYKSLLCPRCIPTSKMLKAFRQRYPQVEIEEVEIIAHPSRAREAGVRQVPTIVVGSRRITRAMPLSQFAQWVFEAENEPAATERTA